MMSKKMKILIASTIILLLLILAFSEYRTKSFVHTFIYDADEIEEKVDSITIWKEEIDSNSSVSIATINSGDENFDKVLHAIKDWKVKKLFFREIETSSSKDLYTITMTNKEKPIYKENFKVLMLKNGLMDINGREYKLVNGTSLEEVIEMMEK